MQQHQSHDHSTHDGHGQASSATATPVMLHIPTGPINCDACKAKIEQQLRANPNVISVEVHPHHQMAMVTVRPDTVSVEELTELAAHACGDRNEVPLPKPEVSSHAHAHTAAPPMDHAAMGHTMDHAAMGHGGHGGHDMSDPRMAAAMEADMRRRFWISLVLSIPVVLYSPMAMMFGLMLPTPFGIPHDWIMLLFATPVALWASNVFHIGAYYSLRSGTLNMSVLVSLGILTSYLFSLGLTLLAPGQETFYEAAVMLAVFLLFGHWMEMKARRGSSDSVRKLLDLTPQRASVERDGQIIELPVAEVLVGDVVVLKPGDKVPVDGYGHRRPQHG